jgi:hypothetical protein
MQGANSDETVHLVRAEDQIRAASADVEMKKNISNSFWRIEICSRAVTRGGGQNGYKKRNDPQKN